jgi:hypothetical protein
MRLTGACGPFSASWLWSLETRRGALVEVVSLLSKALRRRDFLAFPDALIIIAAGCHGFYRTDLRSMVRLSADTNKRSVFAFVTAGSATRNRCRCKAGNRRANPLGLRQMNAASPPQSQLKSTPESAIMLSSYEVSEVESSSVRKLGATAKTPSSLTLAIIVVFARIRWHALGGVFTRIQHKRGFDVASYASIRTASEKGTV